MMTVFKSAPGKHRAPKPVSPLMASTGAAALALFLSTAAAGQASAAAPPPPPSGSANTGSGAIDTGSGAVATGSAETAGTGSAALESGSSIGSLQSILFGIQQNFATGSASIMNAPQPPH